MARPDAERDDVLRIRPLILTLAIIGVAMPLLGIVLDLLIRLGGNDSGFLDGIRNLTFPDAEGNVFAWYSTIILAAVAVAFFLIALTAHGAGRPIWRFVVLGALALAMSADEAAYLHERLDIFADELGLRSDFVYKWLLLGIPLAIVAGVLVLWIARRLDRDLRRRLIWAGIVFLAGAVGNEILGSMLKKLDTGLEGAAMTIAYDVQVFIEESLEILGAVLALRAVLLYPRISNGPEGLAFTLPPER